MSNDQSIDAEIDWLIEGIERCVDGFRSSCRSIINEAKRRIEMKLRGGREHGDACQFPAKACDCDGDHAAQIEILAQLDKQADDIPDDSSPRTPPTPYGYGVL